MTSATSGEANPRAGAAPVGTVSHIQVVANGAADISSLERWKKETIKAGMTDQQKAIAAFETVVRYEHEMDAPLELLHREKAVTDAIKTFNVYGYNLCGPGASHFIELARYAGLRARGVTINGHTVAEAFYNNAWHMFDASYIDYFPKPDGAVASVDEIIAAIRQWHQANPDCATPDQVRGLHKSDGWTGWKSKGPALLAACPFFDAKGFLPARQMDWSSVMRMYDGSKNFEYETGYAMGYQVNVQLRPGEKLTRNWGNKGLHINMALEEDPPWLAFKPGEGPMAYTPRYGDLAPGRVGNGLLEYEVPVGDPGLRDSAWRYENLKARAAGQPGPLLTLDDPTRPGILEIRMTSSYVFLSGLMHLKAEVGAGGSGSSKPTAEGGGATRGGGSGGSIKTGISVNNGLDWIDADVDESQSMDVDLLPQVIRHYEYRIRFIIKGAGTGLDELVLMHDIQHSQRPLPALVQGVNTIAFSAGPQEGTVTLEGATDSKVKPVQLVYSSFHPQLSGIVEDGGLAVTGGQGQITFPVEAPGAMKALRVFTYFRARDAGDAWGVGVSFDSGKTWREVGECAGPALFGSRYDLVTDIPEGARAALVRWSGVQKNTARIFNFRIDADYAQPSGGFRPVRITYEWEEDGVARKDVHVARQAQEAYRIMCLGRPLMKSIVLELEP
jgi:hypothetical protein